MIRAKVRADSQIEMKRNNKQLDMAKLGQNKRKCKELLKEQLIQNFNSENIDEITDTLKTNY